LDDANVPPAGRVQQSVQWVREGGALILLVPPPPEWRTILIAALLLTFELATILMIILAVRLSHSGEAVAATSGIGALVGVACVWWTTAYLMRTMRSKGRVGMVRVDVGGIEVMSHNGRMKRWIRSDVLDVRCMMVGAARGIQEYLSVDVALRGDRCESARLPWPAHTAAGDVEPRLRAAMGLDQP
jgi:hypothetical protein